MDRRSLLFRVIPVLIAVGIVLMRFLSSEKTTNEVGRVSRVALSPTEEARLGLQNYQQVLSESKTVSNGPQWDEVQRVAARIEKGVGESGRGFQWQVSLVDEQQANAFCLPGGKIVVYTGILPVAQTDAGLATVVGHEVAHAVARHGSERMFKEQAAQTLLQGVNWSVSDMSYENQRWVMGILGAGAKYGVLMPWGRNQESEADHLGLRYMSRAGYDPHEALAFWKRMEASGGQAAPEWLSTHPSHGTRVTQLQAWLPEALAEYDKARGGGAIERP